jgi:hypothetical protein
MAIWEEVRHEIHAAMFADELGDQRPDLVFDPMSIDNMSGAVDPYVADHGPTNPKCIELLDTLEGRTNYDWLGDNPDDALRSAMYTAANRLEDRFGSSNPSDWRMKGRKTEFMALGGANADEIYITNRASYQQSIAMRDGRDTAGSILPPSNVGHIGTWQLVGAQVFEEPDDLTEQLGKYKNHEFKPHPVTRGGVEKHSTDSKTLDPFDEIDDDGSDDGGLFGGGDGDDGGIFGGGGPGFTMPAVGAALGGAAVLKRLQTDEATE